MGDAEDILAPSKKRAAGRELNRDKLDLEEEEDTSELDSQTFKRASEEVLATRRIVKIRRGTNPASGATDQPSKNPFAGLRLVPAPEARPAGQGTVIETKGTEQTESNSKKTEMDAAPGKAVDTADKIEEVSVVQEQQTADAGNEVESKKKVEVECEKKEAEVASAEEKVEEGKEIEQAKTETKVAQTENVTDKNESGELNEASKTETEDDKAGNEVKDSEENSDSAGGASFSSFQQLSSTKNAFTGLAGTGFSSSAFSFGSVSNDGTASTFGPKTDQPTFNFGLAGNGSSSFGASIIPKAEGTAFPSKEDVVVETGEENERVVFSADSALFEFMDGSWKERGKGEIKVNVSTTGTEKARLVMRTKGNLRLVMNASLYPEIKLTNMDKKGVTFACVNSISDGNSSLSTFALKFRDGIMVESFREAVEAHKDKAKGPEAVKTPESSPKAAAE